MKYKTKTNTKKDFLKLSKTSDKELANLTCNFEKRLEKYKIPKKLFYELSNHYLFMLLALRRLVKKGDEFDEFGSQILNISFICASKKIDWESFK